MKTHNSRWKRRVLRPIGIVMLLFFLPLGCKVAAHYSDNGRDKSWWELRSDSSQQAPDPDTTSQAIIQVYAARAARWKGAFGVHTWFATKKSNENRYTRLEVIGYALRWGGNTVRIRGGRPDGYWYGSKPVLLRELRGGTAVDTLIDKLHDAALDYRYKDQYKVWPGPNSNTFTAELARQIPELHLELPPTAIGKDYLPGGGVLRKTPSNSGFQVSASGLLGLMLSLEEGLEVNILGLTAGIDLSPPAIKLPGVGRVGFSDFERRTIN